MDDSVKLDDREAKAKTEAVGLLSGWFNRASEQHYLAHFLSQRAVEWVHQQITNGYPPDLYAAFAEQRRLAQELAGNLQQAQKDTEECREAHGKYLDGAKDSFARLERRHADEKASWGRELDNIKRAADQRIAEAERERIRANLSLVDAEREIERLNKLVADLEMRELRAKSRLLDTMDELAKLQTERES